jgi:hypothetical protein
VLETILAEDDDTFQKEATAEFKNWFSESVRQQKDLILFITALTQ